MSNALSHESAINRALLEIRAVSKNLFNGDLEKGFEDWVKDHPKVDNSSLRQIYERLFSRNPHRKITRAKRNPVERISASDIYVEGYNQDGFVLNANGISFPAQYEATYAYSGFGARKKKIRYPEGSIRLYFSPTHSVKVYSLDEAKQRLAKAINDAV